MNLSWNKIISYIRIKLQTTPKIVLLKRLIDFLTSLLMLPFYIISTILIGIIIFIGSYVFKKDLLKKFYENILLLDIKNSLKRVPIRLLKRIFDLTISIFLLPPLIILTVIIGILIKIESNGPVIYAHERLGKGGKPFKCYKFRTMVKDAEDKLKKVLQSNPEMKQEWETYWKISNDPRVTRIGTWLRKSSLDELPQVFNVIKGDMSLIGPRPYLLRELDEYADIRTITVVPPGITGLWQVSGRSDTSYKHRLRLDIWYIMNWSLLLDIFILIKTIKVVLFMKGVS